MKSGRKDGNTKQVPASFSRAKDVAGFKKGGSVKSDGAGTTKGAVVVRKSYSDNGAPVKKLPLKLAAGGAAKERKGFPNTLKPKK